MSGPLDGSTAQAQGPGGRCIVHAQVIVVALLGQHLHWCSQRPGLGLAVTFERRGKGHRRVLPVRAGGGVNPGHGFCSCSTHGY